jgi:hypothetical protein
MAQRSEKNAAVTASSSIEDGAGFPRSRSGGRPGQGVEIFGRWYGPTMSTAEAAELLSCTPEVLQRDRGKGTLPVEPLQLGRRLRWPSLKLAAVLGAGLEDEAA